MAHTIRGFWLMMFVTFMMCCCFILQITAMATVHWSVTRYQGHQRFRTEIGIFTYITERKIMPPDGVHPLLYPVLALGSLMLLFAALVVNFFCLRTNPDKVLPFLVAANTLSGIFLIVTVIAWAVPHNAVLLIPSYSLGIAGGIGGWGVVNGILCLIAWTQQNKNLDEFEDYGHYGPEGHPHHDYPQGYAQVQTRAAPPQQQMMYQSQPQQHQQQHVDPRMRVI